MAAALSSIDTASCPGKERRKASASSSPQFANFRATVLILAAAKEEEERRGRGQPFLERNSAMTASEAGQAGAVIDPLPR